MLDIRSVNHIGIRIADKDKSVHFYGSLGFKFVSDAGFKDGHPIIMKHPSGVVVNLLGPANSSEGTNILMDVDEKHPGITHVALTVSSIDAAKTFTEKMTLPLPVHSASAICRRYLFVILIEML